MKTDETSTTKDVMNHGSSSPREAKRRGIRPEKLNVKPMPGKNEKHEKSEGKTPDRQPHDGAPDAYQFQSRLENLDVWICRRVEMLLCSAQLMASVLSRKNKAEAGIPERCYTPPNFWEIVHEHFELKGAASTSVIRTDAQAFSFQELMNDVVDSLRQAHVLLRRTSFAAPPSAAVERHSTAGYNQESAELKQKEALPVPLI